MRDKNSDQWRIVCVPDNKDRERYMLPMVFDTEDEAATWLEELGFSRGDDFTYVIVQLEAEDE